LAILLPYEEKRLLKQISKGDEKAFRAFYDAYFNHLSAFIYKLCKSTEATEEIIQDVFVKLWVRRHSLSQMGSPEAYIFSMARNKTIDYLRRLVRDTHFMELLTGQLLTDSNDTEEQLNAKDLRELIEEALSGLSEQKKRIFQLSKEEGLSHDQIAEVMHLSKSTVKNHLSETLRHIRGHLRQHPNSEATLVILVLLTLRQV
jgi:RNA polymerase sigma-70 factor (ECF subfamily)